MLTFANGEPLLAVWFGNFYRPAYDDKSYVDKTINLLRQMGFNCVELDSKAWEDFDLRYSGGEASPYVAMQEYMMESAQRNGLSYAFLALYLNGDNLYPNIRFSPPIYGESVTGIDGKDGKWYRYWSAKARESMVTHVKGLMRLYGDHQALLTDGSKVMRPICSMWDPIVAPSFDDDGRQRYLQWLENAYGSISALNQAYQTSFTAFDELRKEDYWFSCRYGTNACYSPEDRDELRPAFLLWRDQMRWRRWELCQYFSHMEKQLHALSPELYLSPNLTQWGYFLNVDGSKLSGVGMADLWDTAMRGIDLYELAPFVDSCHFLSVPVTPAGDPDAYVTACQHSMMRCMNWGKDFLGGIFWGRFLYNDLYQTLTACELVGSMVASGAGGIWSYGVNGLDDGGMLDRVDEGFLASLRTANCWAAKVIPLLKGKPQTDIALLFPSAMAAFEPYAVPQADEHRMDLLGWFKACCDLGRTPDVIDVEQVSHGALSRYKVLIIPCNTCYHAQPNLAAEQALTKWVSSGGVVIHGPNDTLVKRAFGLSALAHEKDCVDWHEGLLPSGDLFCAYRGEEVLASYRCDGAGCVVRNKTVYSFGFLYGASYVSKQAPHVPLAQRNNALYPVSLQRENMLESILARHGLSTPSDAMRGVEIARFENGCILINHTAHPIALGKQNGDAYFQYPINDSLLLPRSAVFVPESEMINSRS